MNSRKAGQSITSGSGRCQKDVIKHVLRKLGVLLGK
jgi:hypothetical protein